MAAALLASACTCGDKPTRNAEEFLPKDAKAALSIPSLGKLADRSQLILATARAGAGGAELVAMSANLSRQLGFDPFTRAGLEAAGLEPEAAAAIGGTSLRAGAVCALPYRDLSKLEATIERLAKDRGGATVKETRQQDAVDVTVLAKSAGGAPVVAYATKDHFLVMAAGERALASVAEATKRAAADSLATEPAYAAARQKVGPRELYVFTPGFGPKGAMSPETLVVGIGMTEKEISARAFASLPEGMQAVVKPALAGGGDAQLKLLPKGGPLYVRGGIDWRGLAAAIEKDEESKRLLTQLREAATEAGVDLDAELLGNLEPGFAIAIDLGAALNLADAFQLDPRRANPFENFTLVGLGKVKDAAKAQATLEKLHAIVAKLGATVAPQELAGAKVYTANWKLGEGLTWGLRGSDLIVTGGFGDKLGDVLSKLKAGEGRLTDAEFAPRAKEALFRTEGSALALDLAKLDATVSKLPDSSFGTGPGAFMARSAMTGLLKQVSRLRVVAAIGPAEGGATFDLSVSVP